MPEHNTSRHPSGDQKDGGARLGAAPNATAPVEYTAWLRGLLQYASQSPALLHFTERGIALAVALSFVVEHDPLPASVEWRTCDRCRHYVPSGTDLWRFRIPVREKLIVTGGFCTGCARLEGMLP